MHHFILQLDKRVTPEDCFELLDDFISPKTDLLNNLYNQMHTVQTNNHVFLVISEKTIDFSKL